METIINAINDTINYISSSGPTNPNYPVKVKEQAKPFKTTTLNANKQVYNHVEFKVKNAEVKHVEVKRSEIKHAEITHSKINVPLKHVKKLNLELEYESHRNLGLADSGYYLDLTETPIGNRPVYKDYSKHRNERLMNDNYKDGNFSCKQPTWSEKCF